ncbi:hypothetical protein F5890DRAFT_1549471 [Lentinula detonsa]|uniref:Uncharacterized protein n=1 Tax=Lentinula detonsa TaxID=2804962 RepID=A0AA38QAK8_9AGAR|nr:hypothetical protein F5890DRAFT_1549471 [Lentinula detonsa]
MFSNNKLVPTWGSSSDFCTPQSHSSTVHHHLSSSAHYTFITSLRAIGKVGNAASGTPSPLTPTSDDDMTPAHPATYHSWAYERHLHQSTPGLYPRYFWLEAALSQNDTKNCQNCDPRSLRGWEAVKCSRSLALKKAHHEILEEFPPFKNHSSFWGADAALRDQLRNLKDTNNARMKRKGNWAVDRDNKKEVCIRHLYLHAHVCATRRGSLDGSRAASMIFVQSIPGYPLRSTHSLINDLHDAKE